MRTLGLFCLSVALLCSAVALVHITSVQQSIVAVAPRSYLGFDRNDYPGDDALPILRKTFTFTSYWLSPPPGEKSSSWLGKRALLQAQGFGFLILFNGRETRSIKTSVEGKQKGQRDAKTAAELAQEEGFPHNSLIFLDIEEGGRLPAAYHEYLLAWQEALALREFRAAVYCSAMPVDEGHGATITSAQDIHAHMGKHALIYWVYNDACPPSPGCTFPQTVPAPPASGFAAAQIWQYAQSPRRKEFTASCPKNYAPDGNCYSPGDSKERWFLDLNVSSTPDPSAAR